MRDSVYITVATGGRKGRAWKAYSQKAPGLGDEESEKGELGDPKKVDGVH
jgi:hypothetical protein